MTNPTKSRLAQALRLIADALESEEVPSIEWIDQSASPLGRVRHCATVRRRIAEGKPGAVAVGRAFRLSAEALQEELAALSRKRLPSKPEKPSVKEELERALRVVGGRQ